MTLHFTDHFKMDLLGCHIAFKLSIYFYKSMRNNWMTFGNGIPKDFYEDLRDVLTIHNVFENAMHLNELYTILKQV